MLEEIYFSFVGFFTKDVAGNALNQRSPNILDAGRNLRSYRRPRPGLFCALKKQTIQHEYY